jgi:hypothetical protein
VKLKKRAGMDVREKLILTLGISLIAGLLAGYILVRLGCGGSDGCISILEAMQKTATAARAVTWR